MELFLSPRSCSLKTIIFVCDQYIAYKKKGAGGCKSGGR
jgi:hypothetical protein